MRLLILLVCLTLSAVSYADDKNLDREKLIELISKEHALNAEQKKKLSEVMSSSRYIGQGNPDVTVHPISREACQENRKKITDTKAGFVGVCGRPHMAPLYDVDKVKAENAKVCIDQFEFPGIPCEYPVVWVRANEAAEICHAMGKRLCDAHEWEGACQGTMTGPDYDFASIAGMETKAAVKKMRSAHNRSVRAGKKWSYGPAFQKGICAQNSFKNDKCNGGNWKECGSNTYPAGSFPNCTSPLQVYDINGNAAEHMNLPLTEDQRAKAGGTYGVTEMKGSWFIWDKFQAHEDWCRWRAPFWHGTRVLSDHSHHNYHLGFRCCSDVAAKK